MNSLNEDSGKISDDGNWLNRVRQVYFICKNFGCGSPGRNMACGAWIVILVKSLHMEID